MKDQGTYARTEDSPILHLIDGEYRDSADGRMRSSMSPSDAAVATWHCEGSVLEIDAAIGAACAAADRNEWSRSPRLRAEVLLGFADRLASVAGTVADQISMTNGKLPAGARHEVDAAVSEARFYAGLSRAIFGRTTELTPGEIALIVREPLPVTGIITPWNAPATLLVRSLAPALAAGSTVVVTAAPQTAIVTDTIIRQLLDSGIPRGVVNVVHGSGVAREVVASPAVDVISFTGSTSTGMKIMEAGAPTLKRLNLELGGSAPVVVFADADLESAVAAIVRSATAHAGQVCVSASRIVAHRSIAAELSDRLVAALSSIEVGDPYSESTQMGPVIDRNSRDRLQRLTAAVGKVGEVILEPESLDRLGSDCYLSPGLLAASTPEARELLREEVFGPIPSLSVVDDEAEAIEQANDTRFGLASSVWTADLTTGLRVAGRLKFGTVWINAHHRLHAEVETGGYRDSGLGRLHGLEALDTFLQSKSISYRIDE
jgi:acyl-CoA reductase-like NAD-dependent aldehyde dehydrogenase